MKKWKFCSFLLAAAMTITSISPLCVEASEESVQVQENVISLKDARIEFEPVTVTVGAGESVDPLSVIASYSIYVDGIAKPVVMSNGDSFQYDNANYQFRYDGEGVELGENHVNLELWKIIDDESWTDEYITSGELSITVEDAPFTSLEIVSVNTIETDYVNGTELSGENFVMGVLYWIQAECIAYKEGGYRPFTVVFDGGEGTLDVSGRTCIVGEKVEFTVEYEGLSATGEVEVKGVDVACVENEDGSTQLNTIRDVIVTALGNAESEKALVEKGYISEETLKALKEYVVEDIPVELSLRVKSMNAETEEEKANESKLLAKLSEKYGETAKYQLLDVSALLQVWGEETIGGVYNLGQNVTITLKISENMKTESGKYVVVRNHNGEIDILDVVVNEDGTLSFETDRFSMYALAVVEETTADEEKKEDSATDEKETDESVAEDTDTEEPETKESETNAPKADEQKADVNNENQEDGAAKTGDSSVIAIWAVLMLFASAAVVTTKKYNK